MILSVLDRCNMANLLNHMLLLGWGSSLLELLLNMVMKVLRFLHMLLLRWG